jgi:hypothetical protein
MANAVTEVYEHTFGGAHNMSFGERAGSTILGLGMAAAAVSRPGPLGLVALLAGSFLALRGISGHCPVKAAFEGQDAAPRQIAYH